MNDAAFSAGLLRAARRRGSAPALSFCERLEPRLLLSADYAITLGPDGEPWVAGDLAAPSADDLAWMQQNMIQTHGARLNAIAVSRINEARRAKGLRELSADEAGALSFGSEALGAAGLTAAEQETDSIALADAAPAAELLAALSAVDNSATQYFPPIRSQGSIGSCATWATTYYAMTYMTALARGWDVRSTTDNSNKFSPKWTYNMINGGSDAGAYFSDAYSLMEKTGAATWAEFPYNTNCLEWVYESTASYNGLTAAQVWRNAAGYRLDQTGTISDVGYSLSGGTGLDTLKTYLANGYILNFGTYINSWEWTTVKDDPATTADDAFVGQQACSWTNGTAGAHAMTVVGYDDNLWIDVNNNGAVDAGEKGALKIANSWGDTWQNQGFAWFAYDALNQTSVVAGGPVANRTQGWHSGQAYWITARAEYTPTAFAEVALQHADRSQLQVSLGTGSGASSALVPTSTWTPSALQCQGGALGFDGISYATNPSAAPVGTFAFDLTDLSPNLSSVTHYFVQADDVSDASLGLTFSACKLTGPTGAVLTNCGYGPRPGDMPIIDSDGSGTAPWAITRYPDTRLSGTVWSDTDNDAVRDADEGGLGNWTVFLDLNGNGTYEPALGAAVSNTTARAIPDATKQGQRVTPGELLSTVAASGLGGAVADVDLTFNITHTRDSDISLTLTSPGGKSVTLFSGVGGSGDNFTDTTLDDSAGTAISAGSAPFTGSFRPTETLSGFAGEPANGTWTLKVNDNVPNSTGTLVNWTLSVSCTYEPAAWTLAGGDYTLTRLAAGGYTLVCQGQTGLTVTSPVGGQYAGTIGAQETIAGLDFGVDLTPPTVIATNPSCVGAGATGLLTGEFLLVFSEPLDDAAGTAGNYELRSPGANGLFGDADDIIHALTPEYVAGASEVLLNLAAAPEPGQYRLTAFAVIRDRAGNILDGNGDMAAGGDYVRVFRLNIAGDVDGDRCVDVRDLAVLAFNYNKTAGATWEEGDLNADGAVDVRDLADLAFNYNSVYVPPTAAPADSLALTELASPPAVVDAGPQPLARQAESALPEVSATDEPAPPTVDTWLDAGDAVWRQPPTAPAAATATAWSPSRLTKWRWRNPGPPAEPTPPKQLRLRRPDALDVDLLKDPLTGDTTLS